MLIKHRYSLHLRILKKFQKNFFEGKKFDFFGVKMGIMGIKNDCYHIIGVFLGNFYTLPLKVFIYNLYIIIELPLYP